MNLLACGSRDWDNPQRMVEVLEELLEEWGFHTVVHGEAVGADRMAGSWAVSRGLREVPVLADWPQYGRSAGPIRNRKMLAESKPCAVAAFVTKPLRRSKGTYDMVNISLKAGLYVYVTRIA